MGCGSPHHGRRRQIDVVFFLGRRSRFCAGIGLLDQHDRQGITDPPCLDVFIQNQVVTMLINRAVDGRWSVRCGHHRYIIGIRRWHRHTSNQKHAKYQAKYLHVDLQLVTDVCQHLIRGSDRLGVHLVSALGLDHVDQLFDDIHVRTFQ